MDTARAAFWLTAGRAARMALAFAAPLVLTRVLLRADYGTFKQIDLAAGLLSPILLVGFDRSLTYRLPRTTVDPRREASTVFWALAAVTLISGLFLAAFPSVPRKVFGLSDLPLLTMAVLLSTSAAVIVQAMQRALVATGRGRAAGILPAALHIPYFVAVVAAALIGRSLHAVVTVLVVNEALTLVACAMLLWHWGLLGWHFDPAVLKRHLAYAAPLWIIGLVETWGQRMDRYLVSTRLGPEIYALFAVGTTGLPFIGIIPVSVRDASAPAFSRYESEGRLKDIARLWKRGSEAVLPIYLLAAGLQISLAHLLVPLMYTEGFAAASPVFMASTAVTLVAVFAGLELVLRVLLEFRFLAILTIGSLLMRIVVGLAILPLGSLPLQVLGQAAVSWVDVAVRLAYARRRLHVGWLDLLPTRGWGLSLAMIAGCAVISLGAEPFLSSVSLLPKTALLLLPWGGAALVVLSGLRREMKNRQASPVPFERVS